MEEELSAEFVLLIDRLVHSGLYVSRGEVLREALRMFFRVESIREASISRFEPVVRQTAGVEAPRPAHKARNARLHRLLRDRSLASHAEAVVPVVVHAVESVPEAEPLTHVDEIWAPGVRKRKRISRALRRGELERSPG